MKKCSKCKQLRKLIEFSKDSSRKDNLNCWCNLCKKLSHKEYKSKNKWKLLLRGIKQRCTYNKHKSFKYYGGRGIKCLITAEELKELWFRDRAYLMKKPSIDRENNNGHYVYNNCSYMERVNNSNKAHNKEITQFDLKGNFIMNYSSIVSAGKVNFIDKSDIGKCCKGKSKSAGGFKWEYKGVKC